MGGQSWRLDAACFGTFNKAFFRNTITGRREAKTICGTCRVWQECYQYAVETKQEYGIWGGVDFYSLRVKPGERHGVRASYAAGCRCDDCVEANRAYKRKWRENNRWRKLPVAYEGGVNVDVG